MSASSSSSLADSSNFGYQLWFVVANDDISAKQINQGDIPIARGHEMLQLKAGDVVRVVAQSTIDTFFITANGERGSSIRRRFGTLRPAVVIAGGYVGKTGLIDGYKRNQVDMRIDGRLVTLPLSEIQPLRVTHFNVPMMNGHDCTRLLRRLPDMPLVLHNAWHRVPHHHWLLVHLPPGVVFHVQRDHAQLDLEIVSFVAHGGGPRPKSSTKVLATFRNLDLSVPYFQLRMPDNAIPDLSFTRFSADTPHLSLISARTVLAMTLRVDGKTVVSGRIISTINSVGAHSPGEPIAAVSAPFIVLPPLLSKTARAEVVARLPGSGTVNQLSPFGIELRFASDRAHLNDTISFDSVKIQLFEFEEADTFKRHTKMWSTTLPGFSATYNANDGTRRVAVCTIPNIVIPFLDACSFSMTCDDGAKAAMRHAIDIKLYPGKFSRSTVVRLPCNLGQPNFDARDINARVPVIPAAVREWTERYIDLAQAQDTELARRAKNDDNVAIEAAAAAPEPLVPPPVDTRDARRDHWAVGDDAARDVVIGSDDNEELDQQILTMSRHKCNVCGYKVSDGKLRRKHLTCAKFERHQTALSEYERLQRLQTHVSIRVIDIETNKAFVVAMAPMASLAGLIWRIEESQNRKVRRLTLLGSEVPSDTTMLGLVGLDLEVELAPADPNATCEHCQTVNEPGLTFCKNEECVRLLPSRLVRTPYEASMALPECVICFENYDDGDEVTHLPCMHGFHADCVTEWLSRKTECPLCGSKVTRESISLQ